MNLVLFLKSLKDSGGLYLLPLYQILCISIKYKSTYAVLQDNKKLGSIFVLVYFVKPVNYPKHVFFKYLLSEDLGTNILKFIVFLFLLKNSCVFKKTQKHRLHIFLKCLYQVYIEIYLNAYCEFNYETRFIYRALTI